MANLLRAHRSAPLKYLKQLISHNSRDTKFGS
jgi:hypothetical protein